MKNVSLQITYRKGKPFAAYIYLPHQPARKSVRCEELCPGLIVDFDEGGKPLGIDRSRSSPEDETLRPRALDRVEIPVSGVLPG